MKTYAQTILLRDDPAVLAAYRDYHDNIWPEVSDGLRGAGILQMRIWLVGRQLFMVMDTTDDFDVERLRVRHDGGQLAQPRRRAPLAGRRYARRGDREGEGEAGRAQLRLGGQGQQLAALALRDEMLAAAEALEFERAAELRDRLLELERGTLGLS